MRASLAFASLLTGFLLVASGCLDDAANSQSEKNKARLGKGGLAGEPLAFATEWADIAVAGGTDHDHRLMSQHLGRSTPNFEFIAHNPLVTDYYGRTAGGHFCGDVREKDGRVLSVVHSWVSDVAFIISDVTDPKDPKKIGELTLSRTHVYDLALTDDQKTVLLATSPGTAQLQEEVPGGPIAMFHDECSGETFEVKGPEQGLPFASGIIVVDVANPRAPAITDFRFFPVNGGHSVQTREVNGKQMLLISVPNGGIPLVGGVPGGVLPLPSGVNSYYVIGELQEGANGRSINILSVYQFPARPSPVPGQKLPGSMHDGYIHKHPITGKWYGYLAYGSSGLVIIDLTDPKNPTFVSHWEDWSKFGKAAPGSQTFVHEALPMDEVWDGKHYTFIGEECGGRRAETPTCLIVTLDTTDPKNPKFVGGWTLPVETGGWNGAMFSPHYLAVQNRTLFITMYHAGVWAVDVSTEDGLRKMPSVGVYLPDKESPKPVGKRVPPYDFYPVVLDTLPLKDGSMIVYDGFTGLYVVRFDATQPAPSPEPWPLNYDQS